MNLKILYLIFFYLILQCQSILYKFTKVYRGGCPYTASFLIHSNLFQLLSYEAYWIKMEAINWEVIASSLYNFQFINKNLYYVNHLSHFEHYYHKKYNFNKAENITKIYSNYAMKYSCIYNNLNNNSFNNSFNNFNTTNNNSSTNNNNQNKNVNNYHESSLAFIPFYGGRPPNVTSDLKVKSLGQGNSLVGADIKGTQLLATLCSILNHFGRAIVGVVRYEDKILLVKMVQSLSPYYRDRVFIKLISNLSRPANLPFGLLLWGKKYLLQMNCYYRMQHNLPNNNLIKHKRYHEKTCNELFSEYPKSYNVTEIITSTLLGLTHQATIIPKSDLNNTYHTELTFQSPEILNNFLNSNSLISHIYYTESDQLLHIESVALRNTILSTVNISTHLIGRRVEKEGDTDPTKPLSDLIPTRNVCGNASDLYSLDDSIDYYVRQNQSLKFTD